MKGWRPLPWLLPVALVVLSLMVGTSIAIRPIAPVAFETVRSAYTPSDGELLDRNGEILDTQRVDFGVRRLPWTPLSEISPALIAAIVDSEDRRFWRHAGVDWLGVAGSVRDSFGNHRLRVRARFQCSSLRCSIPRDRDVMLRAASRTSGTRPAWPSAWSHTGTRARFSSLSQPAASSGANCRESGRRPRCLRTRRLRAFPWQKAWSWLRFSPVQGASPERVASRGCGRLQEGVVTASCAQVREAAARLLERGGDVVGTERLAPQLASSLLKRPGTDGSHNHR